MIAGAWRRSLDAVALDSAGTVVELPTTPRAARVARELVRRHAGASLSSDALEDAVLLVSEVVTNAVLHGSPPVTLVLDPVDDGGRLRVAVSDCRTSDPTVQPLEPMALGGRGMAVVARVATRWGVDHLPGGTKRVWFEVSGRPTR